MFLHATRKSMKRRRGEWKIIIILLLKQKKIYILFALLFLYKRFFLYVIVILITVFFFVFLSIFRWSSSDITINIALARVCKFIETRLWSTREIRQKNEVNTYVQLLKWWLLLWKSVFPNETLTSVCWMVVRLVSWPVVYLFGWLVGLPGKLCVYRSTCNLFKDDSKH